MKNLEEKLIEYVQVSGFPDALMLEKWLNEYQISNEEFSEMERNEKNEHYENLRSIRELFEILQDWKKENHERVGTEVLGKG